MFKYGSHPGAITLHKTAGGFGIPQFIREHYRICKVKHAPMASAPPSPATQALTPFEKEVMTVETAITLPEKCAPLRLPTKYSAEPTLVYGPNPNATTLTAYPSGISGTSVAFPNEMVHVVPNHPFLTEVFHVPVVSQRSAYIWRMKNMGVTSEQLTRTGLGVANIIGSSSDKVEFVDARPADGTSGSPTDQLALHGSKLVAFQAAGRRGVYLDQYTSLALKCLSAGASGIVAINWYRWVSGTWQVVTPEAFSQTMTTGDIRWWQPLDAGVYSMDITCQNGCTFVIWTTNDNPSAPLTVGRMLWGANAVGAFNAVMAMRMYSGLLTQWGSFEKIRINSISQRLTPVSNDYAQGGIIEQAQVPAGDDITDVMDALMNVFHDAVSYVQTLPGRRYEPNKKGSNCPMTPDGPKYWDYRSCIRVDGNGIVQDNWISLDEPMTCLVCAVSTVTPPAGTAAPQFIATTNAHVEAYASNKLLERNRAVVSAPAVDKAIEHLAGMYVVTENPDHVSDILGNLWDSIRGGVGTIGKSIISAGATMGPLAPIAFGVGGAMTGASMLSSGAIKNALGMRASTGARLAPASTRALQERIVEIVKQPRQAVPAKPRRKAKSQQRVVVQAPRQQRQRPTVTEIVEEVAPRRGRQGGKESRALVRVPR